MKDCKTCTWFGKEKPGQCGNYLCRNQSEYDPRFGIEVEADDDAEEELYILGREDETGALYIEGYAYGPPWVSQALLMDDIKFQTPDEARAWWAKEKAREKL